MKKQVALLLAAVMTIALVPVSASAATNNYVDNRLTVPDTSAVVEHNIGGSVSINSYLAQTPSGWSGDPGWYVDGTDLVVPLQRDVVNGYQFKLTLSNAKWYFRTNYQDLISGSTATKDFPANSEVLKTGPSGVPGASSLGLTTYDMSKGTYKTSDPGNDYGQYTRASAGALTVISGVTYNEAQYTLDVSQLNSSVATITVINGPDKVSSGQAGYSSSNWVFRIPLVTYISDSNVDATVTIDPGNASTVTAQKVIFASTASDKTNSTANSVILGRDTFNLDTFVVNELRVGTIRNGERIDLTLPAGYHFSQNFGTDTSTNVAVGMESGLAWANGSNDYGTYAGVYSSGMDLSGDKWALSLGSGSNYYNDKLNNYSTYGYNQDDSVLSIYLGDVQSSTQLRGSIYIDNLQIWADDTATMPTGTNTSDINIHVTGLNNITDQYVLVAQRVDWNLMLKTVSTVPTLVSGRYIGPSWDGTDADDNTHLAATTQLYETASNSWWGARTTVLALPATDNNGVKGAKFRKVKVDDMDKVNSNIKDGNYPSIMYNSNLNTQDGNAIANGGTGVPTDNGVYLNDGERHGGIITVDDNTITITNISLDTSKPAWINFKMWVSVEYGYGAQSGDLTLSIDPSSTSISGPEQANLPSVVIAHIVDPITVATTVSDLKIGYQYQTTSDIQITENGAGYLLQNKTVKVSITDLISSDMYFTNDTKVAVTSGDLRIKNIVAAGQGGFTSQSNSWLDSRSYGSANGISDGSGSISFDIDRESTVASTITISNVAVKLDRTIPVTNKNAYQVVVWGTAIAENYGLVDNVGRTWKADFNTVGDFEDYINVISAPNDAASVLTQEVRVTIGENYYVVNGQTYSMPDASAYISPASNSTMVPVRFVSNAFGLRDDQILWDDTNKTATINAPNKVIQFKLNSSTMIVNGVPITMTSPDGLPVVAEIKTSNGNGRMYLPFRALGNAFGIPVDWDADTQTAIYNKGANTNGTAAVSNVTPVVNS